MAKPLFDSESDRREFFQQLFEEGLGRVTRGAESRIVKQRYTRPPGAMDEISFLATCTRCGLCSEACPHDAIRTLPSNAGLATATPYLQVTQTPCEACPDIPCAAACPTGALVRPTSGWKGLKIGKIVFEPKRCITFQGHQCRVCVDACPVGESALSQDTEGHPVIKAEGCVGCGHCVRDCVSSPSAFTFHPLES